MRMGNGSFGFILRFVILGVAGIGPVFMATVIFKIVMMTVPLGHFVGVLHLHLHRWR